MPVGEIIAIGTELLLGETQDTNTSYIARAFRDAGIDLYRTMIVGDNIDRIAQAIREALSRSDIVITTGGLGPTVDDPTRLAVASLGVEFEFELTCGNRSRLVFNASTAMPPKTTAGRHIFPVGLPPSKTRSALLLGLTFRRSKRL